MLKFDVYKRIAACVLAVLLACPFPVIAQEIVNTEWWVAPQQIFRPEQLDQMLAPIALYPDPLLAQVLAASTYPNAITAADNFIKANPGVSGDVLIDVARDTNWPPSVKAMLRFPDVLAMMNKYLDWTTNLGEAFLVQQRDVMDSVQRLRQSAYEQGMLASNQQAVVRYDQQRYIFIEPANPQMVYVPVYDPTVVYGTWRYPDYPPQRYYYPSYSSSSSSSTSALVSFLAGVLLGNNSGWGGWNLDWYNHQSNVQLDPYNNFINRSYANPQWYQVDSAGRRVVPYDTFFRRNAGYRDYTTAQRFGTRQVSGLAAVSRAALSTAAPLRTQAQSLASPVDAKNAAKIERQQVKTEKQQVKAEKQQIAKTEFTGGAQTRQAGSSSATKAGKSTENLSAFSGVGSGGTVRAASFRGQSSIQSSKAESSRDGGSQGDDKSTDKAAAKPDSGKSIEKAKGKSEDSHGGAKKK